MTDEARYQRIAVGVAAGTELRLRVDGDSMMPLIRPGDVVVVKPATVQQLAPGDIVTVRRPASDIVSHRIITASESAIVTKGDNMRAPDPVWDTTDVLGRVVAIERGDARIELQTQPQQATGWVVSRLSRLEVYVFRVGRWGKQRLPRRWKTEWMTHVAQVPFRLVRRIIAYVNQ